MHPDWARSLRDQCVSAGVAYFFKQWGEWSPRDDEHGRFSSIRDLVPGKPFRMVPWLPDATGQTPVIVDGHHQAPMQRLGKHAAGRLLDGREWNEYPQEVNRVH